MNSTSDRKIFTSLFLISLACFAITFNNVHSAQAEAANNHSLEFSLPENMSQRPELSQGPDRLEVAPGDIIELSLANETGVVMLVIESEETPFASGKFRVTIPAGRNNHKQLKVNDIPGEYKYSIIDISNRAGSENRPVYDPIIIIRE